MLFLEEGGKKKIGFGGSLEGKYHPSVRLMGNGRLRARKHLCKCTKRLKRREEEADPMAAGKRKQTQWQQLSTSAEQICLTATFRCYITSGGESCKYQFNRGRVIGERTMLTHSKYTYCKACSQYDASQRVIHLKPVQNRSN